MNKVYLGLITGALLLLTRPCFPQGVGINTTGTVPDGSAALDINSSNQGLLIPRLTTTERDGISSPANSLFIFNTTANCLQVRNMSTGQWENVYCFSGCTGVPLQPSAIIGASSVAQGDVDVTYFVPHIDGVTYAWSYSGSGFACTSGCTTNSITADFSGTATSGTLTCTPSNACGEGTPQTIAITVNLPYTGCVSTGATVVQDVTSSTGTIWMDRNLGASRVATSNTDINAYGCLYQWGRAADGHEDRGSGTTTTNATTSTPNLGNSWDGLYIVETVNPRDWLVPQDNSLWQGVNGTNNPCPNGYRLPTQTEMTAEATSWSPFDASGAYAAPLKFTIGGRRLTTLQFVGTDGFYWTSTVFNTDARSIRIQTTGVNTNNADPRYIASSVRCIKN